MWKFVQHSPLHNEVKMPLWYVSIITSTFHGISNGIVNRKFKTELLITVSTDVEMEVYLLLPNISAEPE